MNTRVISSGPVLSHEARGSLPGYAPHGETGSRPVQTFRFSSVDKEESDRNTSVGHQKLLLTVEEAATSLSLGRTFVYKLVMRGDLASIKIGSRRRIPVAALEAFVTQRMAEQGERKGDS